MCSLLMTSPKVAKRKRLYYTANDDLYLLREVAGQNPYMQPNRWDDIQKNIQEHTGKEFGVRSLKERLQLLVDKFRQKVDQDKYKSGIEEEVTEMDDLLHQILLLIDDALKAKKTKSSLYQRGHEKREQAVNNITGNGNQPELTSKTNSLDINENEECIEIIVEKQQDMDTPNNKNNFEKPIEKETPRASIGSDRENGRRGTNRGRSGITSSSRLKRTGIKLSSIQFLETKNERWFEIRRRELDLEDKKLEFDKEERRRNLAINEARLQLEQRRFEAELDIFSNQNKLLNHQLKVMEMAFQIKLENLRKSGQ